MRGTTPLLAAVRRLTPLTPQNQGIEGSLSVTVTTALFAVRDSDSVRTKVNCLNTLAAD